ncbi:hypothetical protein [Taibaiella soli]|uniref:Outer membrane protein beta-barrel domain-containing protein n=1 Tax=Taibaiella soli TaxID=1649169 RepID=A0A2W2B4D0_9BACT|nr:hypothetical protein [Taibaiella soli]PZF71119.1 hypothetical protein DN068_20700 [Taibaiella soli]
MKKLLTILVMLIGCSASAQSLTDHDHRFRIYINGAFALPVGAFHNSTENLLTGPAKYGFAANMGIGKYFGADIYLGLSFGSMSAKLNSDAVVQHMQQVLSIPDAYNTATLDGDKYSIKYIGIECAKNFRFRKIELEPYIILAIGGVEGLPNAHFHSKYKNDNYYQQTDFSYTNDASTFEFFYPTIGTRVQKELVSWLYLNAGLAFASGSYEAQLQTITTDLEGNSKTTNTTYRQSVSNLQLSVGLQFRFGRK